MSSQHHGPILKYMDLQLVLCIVLSPSLGFSRYAWQSGGKEHLNSSIILEGILIVHRPISTANSSGERRPLLLFFRSPLWISSQFGVYFLSRRRSGLGPVNED